MNKVSKKQAVIDYLRGRGVSKQDIDDFQKYTITLSDDIYIDKDEPAYENFKDHIDNTFDYHCWRMENVDFNTEENVRPSSSELYNYEPARTFGDVVLCPRCKNGDIGDGERVCSICINKINADDFA